MKFFKVCISESTSLVHCYIMLQLIITTVLAVLQEKQQRMIQRSAEYNSVIESRFFSPIFANVLPSQYGVDFHKLFVWFENIRKAITFSIFFYL